MTKPATAAPASLLSQPLRAVAGNSDLARFEDPAAVIAVLEARIDALHGTLIARDAHANVTAHDLRTPLNTLSGLIQLMEIKFTSTLPDKALEYISYMSRAVTQMEDLSTQFLAHTRNSATLLDTQEIDMRHAIDGVLTGLHGDLAAAEARVDIAGTAFVIEADPALLRLLITHLLRNAVQHRPPQRAPEITIKLDTADDGTPSLSIADNGAGFDPTAHHSIFLPFRNGINGTGVGLATCKEVCKRHGWSIAATSDGTRGATFDITFLPPT